MSPVNSAFPATHLKLQYLLLVDRATYIFQTRITKRLLRLVTTSFDGVVILLQLTAVHFFVVVNLMSTAFVSVSFDLDYRPHFFNS